MHPNYAFATGDLVFVFTFITKHQTPGMLRVDASVLRHDSTQGKSNLEKIGSRDERSSSGLQKRVIDMQNEDRTWKNRVEDGWM